MALSDKKRASNAKWDAANLKRMSLAIPLELFNEMDKHRQVTQESTNGFLKRAIRETIERDKSKG